MKYYLGLDAGGTKTHAVITDELGVVRGFGQSGNGNHQLDRQEAEESLKEASKRALEQAQLSTEQITFAWFGLAGADRETDMVILRPMVERLGFVRTEISCDTVNSLRTGTKEAYGVVIICGTGVNCAGINKQGQLLQCGGFGYMFGDYGGGGDLGVEVFRSVVRAWEERSEETLLTPLLLAQLGYRSVQQMVDDFLDHDREIPASVTPLLFDAHAQGDEVARRILIKQGGELGMAAAAVIRRLGMSRDAFEVVLSGSLLTRGDAKLSLLRDRIEAIVKREAPLASLTTLKADPVVGSVVLAMERDGMQVTTEILNNIIKFREEESQWVKA